MRLFIITSFLFPNKKHLLANFPPILGAVFVNQIYMNFMKRYHYCTWQQVIVMVRRERD